METAGEPAWGDGGTKGVSRYMTSKALPRALFQCRNNLRQEMRSELTVSDYDTLNTKQLSFKRVDREGRLRSLRARSLTLVRGRITGILCSFRELRWDYC
jgi:hypothetical protein